MKIKKAFILMLLILFILPNVSCMKKSNQNKEKSLNIYVDVKDKSALNIIKFLTDEYKKDNPQTKLKINDVLGGGGNIVNDISKGSEGDLVLTSRNTMLELSQKGLISDMSQYYEKNKIGDKFYNIVSAYGRISDKYYGVSLLPYSLEVYYNSDALSKLGITPLTNIKDILNITKKLNSNNVRIPVVIPEDLDINIVLSSIIASNTIKISSLDAIYDNKVEYAKMQNMQDIFSTINLIVKQSGISKNLFELGNESSFSSLANGSIPIVISTSYYFNKVKEAKVGLIEDYTITPDQKEKIPAIVNSVLCMATNGKNQEEAGKFVKFALSDSTQQTLSKKGYITANKKINEKLIGISSEISDHLSKADDNSIIYTYSLPNKFQGIISSKIDAILLGKYSGTEWQDILNEVYK